MPVFTTPSSLRARRAARNPSLPLNVNTAPAEPTADAAPADPTSPNAVSPVSPLPESENVVLKARRAYDRDRQRVKKLKERAERERERTASLNPAHAVHSRDVSGRHAGAGRTSGGAKPQLVVSEDVTVLLPTSPVEEIIADVVERAMLARAGAPTAASLPLEVHLGQLIKPGKARKSKAGDFEVVSEMPAVIALDDQMPDDAELDEPWEHISADELDEKRPSAPSYATVLANAI
ncbi:hypothetical protein BD311DRAFT_808144 [Dichomitus squalens]|uniref:Uncharacterized protein n=1 Tax=Dichomitus squalens TaxID=114155 RepID=A0A4Q9MJC3_9APHY|nr:hypothetical protein BD311DRAFT_808144 [Dichomitus squalens]